MFFRKSLVSSRILQGMTDAHSHILPGVDDGIRSLEDSVKVLRTYSKLGIRNVWLTPHIMEDVPNSTDALRRRFDALQSATADLGVTLHLAAENMIDSLFTRRFAARDILPYGTASDQILVETSCVQRPYDFRNTLQTILSTGYFPVLAHPERYMYMSDDDYDSLHELGVRFQLNIFSLTGYYGKDVCETALMLLDSDMYSYAGSDLHKLSHFQECINAKVLKSSTIDKLRTLITSQP